MRKLVHLYKRRPGMEVADFHARLAGAAEGDPDIPGLVRYVQSHSLLKGYARGELAFDAMEEFAFAHPDLAGLWCASPGAGDLLARREGILDPGATITLIVDVHRIKSRPVPAGAVKSIELVTRRDSLSLADFRHHWRVVHGPLAATIPSVLRYEQNHCALEDYMGGGAPRLDGLAITWFATTDAMREGARTQAYTDTRADEPNFLPDGHLPTVLAREVLER
ncbi:EthD family reductase [Futiania mangrovi]|uniref:EthD family reductase n=1 Tax=Futiania mangrovi TaxID=2959716 RepID=A0A9J6PAA0_9PROT|nr:EthD family reductase [Futiania mangrovii]MCP1336980.1 EthD family reductase [Futiania mangrovii]